MIYNIDSLGKGIWVPHDHLTIFCNTTHLYQEENKKPGILILNFNIAA